MNTHDDCSEGYSSDSSIGSSSSQTTSTSDEEPSLQEINDSRLIQALNYLNDEGGDDSPEKYMTRVSRINHYLVQQLPRQGNDFDTTLYQHLQAIVRKELEAFNQAAQHVPKTVLESNGSMQECEHSGSPEQFSEHSPTSVALALYRSDERLFHPVAKRLESRQQTPGRAHHKNKAKHDAPSDNIKSWPNFPTILSFPATCEKEYRNLPLCDSRWRLQLPAPPKEVEDEIKLWCTADKIAKVVEEFKRHDEELELSKDYTFQTYLYNLTHPKQDDPTNIRHAVNVSPTKPRASAIRSGGQSAARPVRAAYEKALRAALDTSKEGQTSLGKSQSKVKTASPVARRIDRERAISLRRSPRRQSGVSTAPQSAEVTPTEAITSQQGPENHHETDTLATIKSQPVEKSANVAVSKPNSSRKVKRKRSIGERAYTPERKRSKHAATSSLKKQGGATPQIEDKSVRFRSEDTDDTTSDTSVTKAIERKKTETNRRRKTVERKSPRPKTKSMQTPAASEDKPIVTTRKSLFMKDTIKNPSTTPEGVPSRSTAVSTKKKSKATAAGKAVCNGCVETAKLGSTRSGARYHK